MQIMYPHTGLASFKWKPVLNGLGKDAFVENTPPVARSLTKTAFGAFWHWTYHLCGQVDMPELRIVATPLQSFVTGSMVQPHNKWGHPTLLNSSPCLVLTCIHSRSSSCGKLLNSPMMFHWVRRFADPSIVINAKIAKTNVLGWTL